MELNERIEELREEIIKSTQDLVKIKSVEEEAKEGKPFGEGVAKTLDRALEISAELGFKTVNMDGYVGYAEYGEGEDYVAVLAHLDVVPEGDGWIHPPYGAEIHDGKMYGRGTMDDKGPIMSALYGLKAIKDLKLPLSKKVRIIFGTDEETGSEDIAYYLQREKAPIAGFTPDAEYPIIYAEKGLTVFDIVKDLNNRENSDVRIKYVKGGTRANVVPDYCEAAIEAKNASEIIKLAESFAVSSGYDIKAEIKDDLVIVKSVGVSAHGSVPEIGKNAIMQMFKLLEELPLGDNDTAAFIKFLNTYIGMEVNGESFGIGLEDKESGKLTFNVGTVDMNDKKVTMALNLRYPVTFKFEDMINPFNEKVEKACIRVENMDHDEPLYFPADHFLIKTLQKVYKEQTGNEATLLAIGGGTYAKAMPNTVAFGPLFPGEEDPIHQPNEYIKVEDLILNAKIYAKAIYELAK
ncbi:dipeptidase PepV [Clostridium sp. A1-XYC3]|uniref:Dipeptidase PepV n=1 Tax=Clostridium tanneri TaxID=3037988 RepID=A0ABU4JPI8_9CLOT|nr:dipeptidase PepV [Clostridium sp. A1-XYC3]MDW8800055.1 dipeptidase PepV [Clostridium sp. A1-XYC3]